MYATKEAIIGKEHAKNLEPTIFFMDIRAHGKDFDRFVNRAKDEYGIRYVRSMPSTVKELQQSKNLLVKYVREDGTLVEEEFDMIVLSVGLTPPKEAAKLANALGIELQEHGFCRTSLENPVQTSRPGVFVCGAFGGPKDIPETVMEASGAAACFLPSPAGASLSSHAIGSATRIIRTPSAAKAPRQPIALSSW